MIYIGRQQFGGTEYNNSAYEESAMFIDRSIKTVYAEVDSIKQHCFKDAKDLVSVSLPNCATLGNAPFLGCTNLENVSLPNVQELDQEFLFINSPNLKHLDMSKLTTIAGCMANCFGYINNMVTLNLASMDTDADLAGHFAGLPNLTDINLSSMTNVGNSDYMFYGDVSLINAQIPNIKRINSCVSLWENCISIKHINTPFLTDLGNCYRMMANCSNLENVVLGNLTNMGNAYEAIVDCDKLPGLVLPNLRNIDARSSKIVSNCAGMVMVCLPNLSNVNTTTTYNTLLFQNVPNVRYINIPQMNLAVNIFDSSIYLNAIEVNFASAKYFDGTFENNNLLAQVNLSSLQNTRFQNKMFYGVNNLSSLNLYALNNISQSSNFIDCDHQMNVNLGNNKTIRITGSSTIFTNAFVTSEGANIQVTGSNIIFKDSELNIPNLRFNIQNNYTLNNVYNLLYNTNATKTNVTLSGNFANQVYISNSQVRELGIMDPYDYMPKMLSDVKTNYLYMYMISNYPCAFSNLMNSTNIDSPNLVISPPFNSNSVLNISGINEPISSKLNASHLTLSASNADGLTKLVVDNSTNAFVGLNLNLQIYDITLTNSSYLFDSNLSNFTKVINNVTEINNCNNLFNITNFSCAATTNFVKAKTIYANNLFYGVPESGRPALYLGNKAKDINIDTPFVYGSCQSSYIGFAFSSFDNFRISNISNTIIQGLGNVKTISISNVTGYCNLNNLDFIGTNIERLENTYVNSLYPKLINIANMNNVIFEYEPNFALLNRIEDDASYNVTQNDTFWMKFDSPNATYIGNNFMIGSNGNAFGVNVITLNMPNLTHLGYNFFHSGARIEGAVHLESLRELYSDINASAVYSSSYDIYANSLTDVDKYWFVNCSNNNLYLQNLQNISNITIESKSNYYLGNLKRVTNCIININSPYRIGSSFFDDPNIYYYNTDLALISYTGGLTINHFNFGTNKNYTFKTSNSIRSLNINHCHFTNDGNPAQVWFTMNLVNIGNLYVDTPELGSFRLVPPVDIPTKIYSYINALYINSTTATGYALVSRDNGVAVNYIYANNLTTFDAGSLFMYSNATKQVYMPNVTNYISNLSNRSPFPNSVTKIDIGVCSNIPAYFFYINNLSCLPQFTSNVYLTYVGDRAFPSNYNHILNMDVNIQSNYIGQYAFGAARLTGVVNLSAITNLGYGAFTDKNELTATGNLASLSEISDYAFRNCNNMAFDGNLSTADTIRQGAFQNCSKMYGELQVRRLHEVSQYAFYNCNNLTSFNGNASNLTGNIGMYAFYNCQNLFGEPNFGCVAHVGEYAFANCKSLTNIRINRIQDQLAYGLFEGCSNLRYCWCHENLSRISGNMFNGCVNLTNVRVDGFFSDWEVAKVNYIEDNAFNNCHSLTFFNCTLVTQITNGAFNNCWSLTNLVSLQNVDYIGSNAFANCRSHTNAFTFGPNLGTIHTNAFDNCIDLSALDFSSATRVPSLQGVLWTTAPTNVEIRVPASLYDSWKTAANWARYASLIVSV